MNTIEPLPRPVLPYLAHGSCHCGRVTFEVMLRSFEVSDCNCSVCTKKGNLAIIVPDDDFSLKTGEDQLSTYTFNTHAAKHHFCSNCGMHGFYRPRSHPDQVSVNVRCLDDAPLTWFDIVPFDGQHWELNVARFQQRIEEQREP